MWYLGEIIWNKDCPTIEQARQKHKRVGELLFALHSCDPSWEPTEKQKDPEYWTSQAMLSPGYEVAKLEERLIQRKKEFSTAVQ